jgi:hypothetical protein
MSVVVEPARILSFWRRLAGAHAFLAASVIAWHVIGGMPRTAAVSGGGFAASPVGRALAMVTVLGGVVALVVVLVTTFRLRRDLLALVLFAGLIGALWDRAAFDAFDVTWLSLVAVATAIVSTSAHGHDRRGCGIGVPETGATNEGPA